MTINFSTLGRLHEMLVSRRIIRSGGRTTDIERIACDLLLGLDPQEYEALETMLDSQGWLLQKIDDTNEGVKANTSIWLLLRRPDAAESSLLTMEPVWRLIGRNQGESIQSRTYWFTFLWLILMSFLYEKSSRALSEVSRHVEATFIAEDLELRASELIEDLRQRGVEIDQGKLPVAAALLQDDAKGVDRTGLRKRIGRFIEALTAAHFIEEYVNPSKQTVQTYRQTILFAKQMEVIDTAGLLRLVTVDTTAPINNQIEEFLVDDDLSPASAAHPLETSEEVF